MILIIQGNLMSNQKTISRTLKSAEFKAKVALEAHKGDRTINEIALIYHIHPGQVSQWKNQLIEGVGRELLLCICYVEMAKVL